MRRTALTLALGTVFMLVIYTLGEIKFLAPYKRVLFYEYGERIAIYLGMMTFTLYVFYLRAAEKLLLKRSGRKLYQVDKELRAGGTFDELSNRLEAEK